MVLRLADNRNPDSLASRMRRRRMRLFLDLLAAMPDPIRILDVGGTLGFWNNTAPSIGQRVEITLLNLSPIDATPAENVRLVQGDARKMTGIGDGEFDVCFSNSVIEHVGTLYDQQAMAREIARVARAYFVQTPNRWFPLEPHFLLPLWQFWPLWLRGRLHRRFELGWIPREPDRLKAQADVEQVRLLDFGEMRLLFPGAEMHRERVGFLTKSLIAIRRPS